MIHLERRGNTALVKLDRGVINPINLQLVTALSDTIEELKNDPEVHAMVLSSASDKFFSIGLDIPELLELNRDGMRGFFISLSASRPRISLIDTFLSDGLGGVFGNENE